MDRTDTSNGKKLANAGSWYELVDERGLTQGFYPTAEKAAQASREGWTVYDAGEYVHQRAVKGPVMGKELTPEEVLADLFDSKEFEMALIRGPAAAAELTARWLTDGGFKIVDWKEAAAE